MPRKFSYENITFKKDELEDWLTIKGEVTNKADRNYNAVVFRIVVYVKTMPIGSATITINGFINGQTRTFEKHLQETTYSQIKDKLNLLNYEIFVESMY